MKRLVLIIIICTFWNLKSQSSQLFFTEALDAHLPSYLLKVEKAIATMEQDKVNLLFDQLVKKQLRGSLMNDFTAKSLTRKDKDLLSYEKPILLLTHSSWRLSCKGELPALNKIAKEYGNRVDVILLFWGDNREVRKLAKGYHKNINMLYVDDSDNNYSLIIKNLKHSLGLPLAYTLTSHKAIVNIKRRRSNKISVDDEEATLANYELYKTAITELLFAEEQLSLTPIVINR